MKFVFTGQQQSLLDHPPPLLTSRVSQAIKGLVKAWCSGSGFSAVFSPHCAQGAALGEMGMQSGAAQNVSGNTARAASFLFTCCSSVSRIIISVYTRKKNPTQNLQ